VPRRASRPIRRLRLFAWNIRQGGGTRLSRIVAAIAQHDADVLVISEYRGGESGERLRAALAAIGYVHVTAATPPAGGNGTLIAARQPFDDGGPLTDAVPEPYRIVRAYVGPLRIHGVYMPNLLKKVPYWQALLAALAAESLSAQAVAIGDFNTCRAYVDEPGAIDACAHFMDEVAAIGYCDLWRERNPEGREFSWYSTRGNGFRIDHAFLSPALAGRVGEIRYSHDERTSGLSDHSALLLDLDI
jgi:exodeoxyribonuclease III